MACCYGRDLNCIHTVVIVVWCWCFYVRVGLLVLLLLLLATLLVATTVVARVVGARFFFFFQGVDKTISRVSLFEAYFVRTYR